MVKHQIKKFYDKQFTMVTTHKNVQNYYNEKCTYNINVHAAICYMQQKYGIVWTLFEREGYFFFA